MSAIPVNEMLLQELNQLTGIKMLTSDFLEIFSSSSHFLGGEGQMTRLSPPADAHESMKVVHRISLKNKMTLKKFQVIWQT